MAETITDGRPDDAELPLLKQPVHLIAGWLLVVLTVLFAARLPDIAPMMRLAVLSMLTGATVLLAPRGTLSRLRIGISAVVFLMVWMVSVGWSTSVGLWWGEFRFFAVSVGTMTVAVSVLPSQSVKRALLFAMYAAIGLNWAISLTDSSTHFGVGGAGWRGSFVHKNPMGAFMSMAIVTAHAFDRNAARKWFATIAAVALLLLSRSATAAALLVISLPALWSTMQFRKFEPRQAAARFATLTGLSFVFGVIGIIQAPAVLNAYGKDETLSSRTDIWTFTIPYIQDRPFFGWGLGVWLQRGVYPVADINQQLGFRTAHAHNMVIEILFTVGVVGLLAFVWFWASTVRAGWRAAQAGDDAGAWTVAICLIVAVWGLSETLSEFHVALFTVGLMLSLDAVRRRQSADAAA